MKNLIQTLLIAAMVIAGAGVFGQAEAQSNTDQATVTLTEYSDYQCPACAYYHPMVQKLMDNYGDKIDLELRFYPLNSHQYGALAARAAQAAKNQGKFHEMHNLLFENQSHWASSGNPAPIFVNYARELGLDVEQFREDLNSAETQRTVMEQKKQGVNKGVRSTPTFFLDGEKINDLPRSYQEFEKILQSHLQAKGNNN